jgi:glc operon protein GlcG
MSEVAQARRFARTFSVLFITALCSLMIFAPGVQAQQQPAAAPAAPPPSVTPPITLEQAKTAADAAMAEAKKINVNMAIAVVEPSGDLVYFVRMDGTQYASLKIAEDKARGAATFRRPTKGFADRVAGGETALLSLRGVVASGGGVPIAINGKLIGAIGLSGGSAQQDHDVAMAGAAAVK